MSAPGSQAGSVRIVVLAVVALVSLLVLGAGSCGYLVFRSVRMSEAFRMAVDAAGKSPAVLGALGQPIEAGLLTTGSVDVTGPSGEAALRIPLSGPKGEGALHVQAVKKAGEWTMTLLQFERADAARVDLLKDAERAALTRSCEGGDADDCHRLALHLSKGTYGETDLAAAAALLEKSCALGSAAGCSNLGICYENGWGVERDLARALALYERACASEHFISCEYAGNLPLRALEDGPAPSVDVRHAAALLKRACDNKLPGACSDLGVLHERGWGTRPDAERAATLYGQGCDGGYAKACNNLAKLYTRGGAGVPADPNRAAVLFTKACAGGEQEACGRLASRP